MSTCHKTSFITQQALYCMFSAFARQKGTSMFESRPRIRSLGIDDYDALLDLWRRAGLRSLRPQGRDSRVALAQQLTSGTLTILGIDADKHLLGAVIATHDSRKGWINRLAVDPQHRQRGYAAQLVTAAENWLGKQHIGVFACLIEGGNTASLALFRKAGYLELPTTMHYLTKRESADA